MKLARINRSTGEEVLLKSNNIFTGNYQDNLRNLYQVFNLKCYCAGSGAVTMHIRRMQSSGLFFLADNPTSPNHNVDCELYSARKNIESPTDIIHKINPFKMTTRFSERITSNSSFKKSNLKKPKNHSRNVMSGLEGLFVTLISNAFCDYSFGGFVSIKDVTTRIIENKENAKIKTGDTDLVSNIYFGTEGIELAKDKAQKLNTVGRKNSELPVCIWFGLVFDTGDEFVVSGGDRFTCEAIYIPHKAKGPFLAMGTIPPESLADFKQMLLIPVVSKSIVLPVHNQTQREKVIELQKWVYGRNRGGKYRFYIQKPLKPIVDQGKVLLADLLIVRKNKSNGDKTTLILANKNECHLSSVYDCEVINMNNVTKDFVSDYFRVVN